ncbi:hypothetical protein VTK73DRAFT_8144 [Phialemonium thermophilum]|uniref:Cas1p 10 TM acyl transferase domain-containing protein n=1 Tax=Phialemonium thermophilum TaxID=223376 RepID=A0ABR3WAF0_9PEZI
MLRQAALHWAEQVARASLSLLLVIVVLRHIISGRSDPLRCRDLLTEGSWPPEDTLVEDRGPYYKWEPDTCRMHEYSSGEIRDCLASRRLLFVGDSTTRQIFWSAARRLDTAKTEVEYLDFFVSENQQRDLTFESHDVKLQFVWDPWLNSSRLFTELRRYRQFQSAEDVGTLTDYGEDSPSLIVLGAPALFAARHGGEAYFDIFARSIDRVQRHVKPQRLDSSSLAPRDYAHLENQILLAPVTHPARRKLTPPRRATLTPERLGRMDKYLAQLSGPLGERIAWSFKRMAQKAKTPFDQNGLHVNEGLADRRFDIAMNVRCNPGLSHKGSVSQVTCCVGSPPVALTQSLLLLAGAVVVPALLWVRSSAAARNAAAGPPLPSTRGSSPLKLVSALLGCAVYCYVADRTHGMAQAEKHFSIFTFAFTWAALFTASLFSISWTTGKTLLFDLSDRSPVPSGKQETDPGFLPRCQSDEWKGLMQTGLLVLQYQETSGYTSLYKITRLFGACYVFMSVYGHAIYFLRTGDVSFRRLATVLFRLNALGCVLALALRSGAASLYMFPQVVSFWFLFTFVTFRLLPGLNGNPTLLCAKIVVLAVIMNALLSSPKVIEGFGYLFRFLVSDAGTLRRLIGVDRFLPCFGILTALIAHRVSLLKARQVHTPTRLDVSNVVDKILSAVVFPNFPMSFLQPLLALLSLVAFGMYFYLSQADPRYRDAGAYDRAHAYLGLMAVLAYAFLRNCHRLFRNVYLVGPAYLGRIALEVHLLQHHIWLSGNGTGILRTGLWSNGSSTFGFVFDAVLLTAAFLSLSFVVHEATWALSEMLFGGHSTMSAGSKPSRSASPVTPDAGEDCELVLPTTNDMATARRFEIEGKGWSGDIPTAGMVRMATRDQKRAGSRLPSWLSRPEARAGVLLVVYWLGNLLNT